MPDRVTPTQIGRIFGGRYSGGRGKPAVAPTKKRERHRKLQTSGLKFQIEEGRAEAGYASGGATRRLGICGGGWGGFAS
jgi:hypothetical protein